MSTYKFDDNDVFINTLEGYPEYSFFINNGVVYIDQRPNIPGSASYWFPDNPACGTVEKKSVGY